MTAEASARAANRPFRSCACCATPASISCGKERARFCVSGWRAKPLSPYIDRGLAFLQGTWADRLAAPLYYAHMSLRSCLPSFHPRPTPFETSTDGGFVLSKPLRAVSPGRHSWRRSVISNVCTISNFCCNTW